MKLKLMVKRIIQKPIFESVILISILLSSIHLALDSPLLDPAGTQYHLLKYIDLAITIIFSVEALLKLFSFGLIFNGKESYFRSTWNLFDFIIVILSVN